MAVDDAHVFPGFLTPVLTQLFFPKQLITLVLFSHVSAERAFDTDSAYFVM